MNINVNSLRIRVIKFIIIRSVMVKLIRNKNVIISIVRVVMMRFFVVFFLMMVYCLKKMNGWVIGIMLSGDFLVRFLWIVNMVFFWKVEFGLFFKKVMIWDVMMWFLLDDSFIFCLKDKYLGFLRNSFRVGIKCGLVMFILFVVEKFVKILI